MSAPDDGRRMGYFMMLTREEQREAIARLSRSGMSVNTIAAATRLSVEQVQKTLGEARALEASP